MPGFLIPADLTRLIPAGVDPLQWAEVNLLASPGALVADTSTGTMFQIPTLVPAVKPDGSCIHLDAEGRCGIHAVAPFGCSHFDCGPERGNLSHKGIRAVLDAHNAGDLYTWLWEHLWNHGRRQKGPGELRAAMQAAEEGTALVETRTSNDVQLR